MASKKIVIKNSISHAHQKRGASGSGYHENRNLRIKKGSSRKIKHKSSK